MANKLEVYKHNTWKIAEKEKEFEFETIEQATGNCFYTFTNQEINVIKLVNVGMVIDRKLKVRNLNFWYCTKKSLGSSTYLARAARFRFIF